MLLVDRAEEAILNQSVDKVHPQSYLLCHHRDQLSYTELHNGYSE